MEKKQVEAIMELIGAQPNAEVIQALLETEHKAVVLMGVYEEWYKYFEDDEDMELMTPDQWEEVALSSYQRAEDVLWDTVHGYCDQ